MKLTLVIVYGRIRKICDGIEACTVGSSCADPTSQCIRACNLECEILEETMTRLS